MNPINVDKLSSYISDQKTEFYEAILPKMQSLSLERLLLHNPYFLMAQMEY